MNIHSIRKPGYRRPPDGDDDDDEDNDDDDDDENAEDEDNDGDVTDNNVTGKHWFPLSGRSSAAETTFPADEE